MGKNVDYDKVKLNFPSVFQQLNKAAKDFAEQKAGGNIVADYGTFDAGGGNVGVAVYLMMKEDGIPLEDKKVFLDVAKEYVKFAVGEDQVASVSEDKLLAITKQDHDEGQGDHTANESLGYFTKSEKTILNMLFEEDSSTEPTQQATDSTEKTQETKPEDANSQDDGNSEDKPEEKKEDSENNEDPNSNIRGYVFTYWLTVSGKSDFLNKVKDKSKGLFSGIISDLQSFKLNWKDGTSTAIGQILNPDKWKEAFGTQDIDKDKVVSDVVAQFRHDFNGTSVSSSDVSVDQRKEILTKLNRLKKLTPDLSSKIKSKIPEDVFSVVIQVGDNDVKFSDYNEGSVAKTMTKAFGTNGRLVDMNSVSEKDVIKVPNIQAGEEEKNSEEQKSLSEDEKTKEPNPEKKDGKKDGGDRQKIDDFIRKTLADQVVKVFSGQTKPKQGFKQTIDFIKEDFGSVHSTKIERDLMNRSSGVLYVIGSHTFGKKETTKESMNSRDNLVSLIFEDDTTKSVELPEFTPQMEKFRKAFVENATKALVNTVNITISKNGLGVEEPNLDVISTYKIREGKEVTVKNANESFVDPLIGMLFEDAPIAHTTYVTEKENATGTVVTFYVMLPDPTQPDAKKKKKETGKASSLGDKIDWYIIPNKHIKSKDPHDKNEKDEVE